MSDREKTAAVATPTAPAPAVGSASTLGIPGTAGTPGAPGAPLIPPRRSPGHRGADVKDTVAEMAAKAHEISLEAGSKMAAAMKDVVGAAAGLTGLVLESARDLLQYMVRRGQMTQEEADKLMREVESSHAKRKPFTPPPHAATKAAAPKAEPSHTPHVSHTPHATAHTSHASHAPHTSHTSHASHAGHSSHSTPVRHVTAPAKHAAKHPAAKKPAAKKTTMKPAAKKHPVKSATKSKPKASGKSAKKR
jgi:polyhydroxyalkanoate synthesis regulator phasin